MELINLPDLLRAIEGARYSLGQSTEGECNCFLVNNNLVLQNCFTGDWCAVQIPAPSSPEAQRLLSTLSSEPATLLSK